jgi:hypothetical protein
MTTRTIGDCCKFGTSRNRALIERCCRRGRGRSDRLRNRQRDGPGVQGGGKQE